MTAITHPVRRISAPTIYKVLFLGSAFSVFPYGALMGVLSLFGLNTVTWNGAHVHGFWGLVTGTLIGVLFVLVLTLAVGSACAIGMWIYSKFEPISITYFSLEEAPQPGESEVAVEASSRE